MRKLFASLACFLILYPTIARKSWKPAAKKMPAEWIDKDTHHKVVRYLLV
jgi:hypothetical protein